MDGSRRVGYEDWMLNVECWMNGEAGLAGGQQAKCPVR
jgi:hypothetical protein